MENQRAFTLIELMTVIAVLPIVVLVTTGLFNAIILDIPQSYKVVEANGQLLRMLNQMHQDVKEAKNLPESKDKRVLLVEKRDSVVRYEITEDGMERSILPEKTDAIVWKLPKSRIDWQVWQKDGKGYAVEIQAAIEREVRGVMQRKMANSHLYFVGAGQMGLKK